MNPEAGNKNQAAGSGWVARVKLTPPSLQDNTGDVDRLHRVLCDAFSLARIDVDLRLVKALPDLLRANQYRIRCIVFQDQGRGVLVYAGPDDPAVVLAGLAVDLGTTRVVMRLVNLQSRRNIAEAAFDNPQTRIGPDILARIHHTDQAGGLSELQQLILERVNCEIGSLCRSSGLVRDNIHLISVAGNTTMSHLLAGLPVHGLIREPYIPAANRMDLISARQLGIVAAAGAKVFIFPNVGSYFGGDLIAGIIYSGLHRCSQPAILVDVGTNAEVVLGNQDWMMACAGAAGPALEGGMSRMGTTAGPGVIDQVRIDPRTRNFKLRTIEALAPAGICGSGVIDLAAQLFLAGMIDIRGKLIPGACGDRWKERNDMAYLTIVPAQQSAGNEDLCISQADLDSLVRAKAAMYAILETLTGTMGIQFAELKTFYVAGTFGSLIDPQSAIAIGMIPDLPLACFQTLGNSSLGGAALALTRRSIPAQIEDVRDRITYLELNVNQDFMNRFSAARFIPHTDKGRFPSVQT